MDEMEQAHLELDRLQGIITRHEGHIFALRGWLLTIVVGLLAAYYTDNIEISENVMRLVLPLVAVLFLILESRHANLVEAVVERVTELESRIVDARHMPAAANAGWYDGPKVSLSCEKGANRWWPHHGMTFVLNETFYIAVILIILFLLFALPPKKRSVPPPGKASSSSLQRNVVGGTRGQVRLLEKERARNGRDRAYSEDRTKT